MTPQEKEERVEIVRRLERSIEKADRVSLEIRRTIRETEQRSAERRERFRRAGILP